MAPTRVMVVCGGRSSEHEVSLRSAREMLAAMSPSADDHGLQFSLLALDRNGAFHFDPTGTAIPEELVQSNHPELASAVPFQQCDVVFPLLHGTYGEDGCFQGFLETLGVAYVGSGVLSSALCMDKIRFRQFLDGLPDGPRQTDWVGFRAEEWQIDSTPIRASVRELGYPVFVKPSSGGSSVGIGRISDESGLDTAIRDAKRFDRNIIVEAAVARPREVELAVLGNGGPETLVSRVGEIVLRDDEWYDYDTKYVNDRAQLQIPAQLPESLEAELQAQALKVFRAADCRGLARIDFLLGHGEHIHLNEVNTLPGFTSISMYSKLMAQSGFSYSGLVKRLVELARQS